MTNDGYAVDTSDWLRHECFACGSELLCPIRLRVCPKCREVEKFHLMN